MEKVVGHKIRARSESFNDHYSQATLFWNSLTEPEKEHLVSAAHFELGKVERKAIRERQVANFYKVDPQFAALVAAGIGVEIPGDMDIESTGNYEEHPAYDKIRNGKTVSESPAVSIEKNKVETAKSRRVAILLDEGFDYNEVMQVKEALEAAGANAKIVSQYLGKRLSASGQELEVDKSHVTSGSVMFDAIYIPDGGKNIRAMMMQGEVLHFISEAFKHCKPIATSGNGIALLERAFVVGIDFADKDSGKVMSHKGVVTAGADADAGEFAEEFIKAIKKHRHWEREKTAIPA